MIGEGRGAGTGAAGTGELVEVDEAADPEREGDRQVPAIAREDIDTARGYADASRV